MTSGVGYFDQLGNPCLKFHLCGVAHPMPGLEFDGIIDTGFSGFIQLPIQHAFSLKLPLEGTSSYILADGSRGTSLTALAQTTFGEKTVAGVVSLSPSQEVLVGMDFFRRFKMGMLMASGVIVLLDEDELEKMKSEAARSKETESPLSTEPAGPPPDSHRKRPRRSRAGGPRRSR